MLTELKPSIGIPDEIKGYGNDSLSLIEFEALLSETTYAQILKGRPRFDYFRPISVTPEEWINMLGPDVDNYLHGQYTLGIAREFFKRDGRYNTSDSSIVQLTCLDHDMPEAITGDKRKPDMTPEDDRIQAEILCDILDELLPQVLGRTRTNEITRETVNILLDKESKLGKTFEAIERIGYAETALKAWKIKKQGNVKKFGIDTLNTSMGRLSHAVFTSQTYIMVDYAKQFPYMKDFLIQNAQDITEILVEAEDLGTYDEEAHMKLSRLAWDEFNSDLAA
jgi:5'-deoxynucleotidase YfbR-like HD superfamily hydrolase